MGLGYTYKINTEPYVCKKQQNFTVLEEKSGKENTTNLCVSSIAMLPGKLNFTSNEDTGADKCKDKVLPVKKTSHKEAERFGHVKLQNK